MSKTIKQIADELGVSKTAVRKKIENLGLSDKLQTNGNQFAIDKQQENLIKSAFQKKEPQTKTANQVSEFPQTSLQLVCTLTDQLKEKDQQIKYLQETLNATIEALTAAQENVKAAQLLQANAEQKLKLLEQAPAAPDQNEPAPEEVREPEKKPWWKFW